MGNCYARNDSSTGFLFLRRKFLQKNKNKSSHSNQSLDFFEIVTGSRKNVTSPNYDQKLRDLYLNRPLQSTIECPLCLEITESSHSMVLSGCDHTICVNCASKWIGIEISEKSEATIPCPCGPCSSSFSIKEIEAILSKDQFQRYQRRLLELAVTFDPSLHFCQSPNCHYIVCWVSEESDGAPKLDCPQCHKASCLLCGMEPYHENLTCAQGVEMMKETKRNEKIQAEMKSLEYLNQHGIRNCRRCRARVVKESGCNKMKCRCGYKFCYKCGAQDAICRCTPMYHGFWDNVEHTGDFT